jgi:16S rRNA (uracil1498-N3)-methyltransferase
VLRVKKHEVELEIVERRNLSRELPFELTLAVALPKGERQKWLVEKLTELGVTRLVPLVTERGVAQPVAAALERLKRGVIEASKQCGRNRLMEIADPRSIGQLVTDSPVGAQCLLADPAGAPLERATMAPGGCVIAAVGPEGGFAPSEMQTAREAGWEIVSLGPRILRVETAAIVLATSF